MTLILVQNYRTLNLSEMEKQGRNLRSQSLRYRVREGGEGGKEDERGGVRVITSWGRGSVSLDRVCDVFMLDCRFNM